MNRSELIEAISGHTGLTNKESEAALAAVVYEITAGVRAGNPVRITGFGSFKLRQRAARRGRNPQTGAPVKVKASKGIGFTPGVRLKADLNSRSAPAKPSLAPPKRQSTTASKATASKATTSKATTSKATASKVVATKATAKASSRTVRATPSKTSPPAGKKVGTRGR